MSEFKYACPVCGQHIRCDSSQVGTVMECPTCFQKITVPQSPSSDEQKFIITGTKKGERPVSTIPEDRAPEPEKKSLMAAVIVAIVLAGAAVAAWFAFSGRILHEIHGTQDAGVVTVTNIVKSAPIKHGAIGLGSWNTMVEYSNVVVTQNGQVLFKSDFSGDMSGWRIGGGTWTTTNGVLLQTSGATDCRTETGDAGWSDYTLSVRARKVAGREGFLIMFNVEDAGNWTWWNIGGWGNTRNAIENCVSGGKSTLGRSVPGQITNGEWYDLRIELNGQQIRCYLNDALIHDETYPPAP